MTWLLYYLMVQTIPEGRLREFYTAVEDWDALRAFDNSGIRETDTRVGGLPNG